MASIPVAEGERAFPQPAALPAATATATATSTVTTAAATGVRAQERAETWLDVGRIVAVVAVVMLHVSAPLTHNFDARATWWVGDIYNSAGRWCVPLFVMVSGALLLDPARQQTVGTFYRKRLTRVGLPLAAWTLAYFIWDAVRSPSPPSAGADLYGIAAGRPYYHLWFLYMLIGLYLLTPILRRFIATATRRELRLTVAVLLAVGIADSFLRFVGNLGSPNALTLFVPYIGYYIAGSMIRRNADREHLHARALAAIFVLALVVTALATFAFNWAGRGSAGDWISDYLSPTTVVATFAIFMLLRAALPDGWAADRPRLARAVAFGGVTSFGVYLVHPMLMESVYELSGIHSSSWLPILTVPVLVAVVVAISLAAVVALRRLPATREFV